LFLKEEMIGIPELEEEKESNSPERHHYER
jgi:hypothetical protein